MNEITNTLSETSSTELSVEEYNAIRNSGPQSPEATVFMEQHGIVPGQDARLNVDGRVFSMTTNPNDFGTRVEEKSDNPRRNTVTALGGVATHGLEPK